MSVGAELSILIALLSARLAPAVMLTVPLCDSVFPAKSLKVPAVTVILEMDKSFVWSDSPTV